jgi:carotenoid cleavage dioxygenase
MQFPRTRNFTGFFAPSGVEAEVRYLPVIDGAVPEEIAGAFYRVAPDPQFPPLGEDDIWFNGDGMVTRFEFNRGDVSLRQRWVHTDKFKRERAAGRALFGAYRNPLTDDPSVKGVYRGTANTNVVVHAGKLFALKEDSPAVAMDPVTLETIGNWHFGGAVTSETFTAHPKIDLRTGEMLAFGYAAKGLLTKDMAYYVIRPDGTVAHEAWFELPYYCMMHDFGITADYVVFHVVPIVSDWQRLEQRKPHFGFDTKRPVYLGVMPRRGTGDQIRWFEAPTVFASHVMNAHNVGTTVHFDTVMARGNMFPFFPDVDGAPFSPEAAEGRLTRWTVDMRGSSKEVVMRQLCDLPGEFPRIDERFAGQSNTIGFQLVQDDSKPFDVPGGKSASGLMLNTLARIEIDTGKADTYWIGPVSSFQEPCFIPRPGSQAEGDGYLVVVENRLAELASRLLLFDAQALAKGPIATLALPFRLRAALHGNWVAGSAAR